MDKWVHPNPAINIYNSEHPKSYADEYLSYKYRMFRWFPKLIPLRYLSYEEWYKQEAN